MWSWAYTQTKIWDAFPVLNIDEKSSGNLALALNGKYWESQVCLEGRLGFKHCMCSSPRVVVFGTALDSLRS